MGRMSILDEMEETDRAMKSATKAKLVINYLMALPFLMLIGIIMIGMIKSVDTEYERGNAETACVVESAENAAGQDGAAAGADTLNIADRVQPDAVEAEPAKTEHKDSGSEGMHRPHSAPKIAPIHHPALRHSFRH